jgi:hypothetical protein
MPRARAQVRPEEATGRRFAEAGPPVTSSPQQHQHDCLSASPAPRLQREVFRTSRLLEFCNQKELVAQTGHAIRDWPLVIEKELCDNALDACEEAGISPDILIKVSTMTGEITVVDNGPGIPSGTVASILDYGARVSSREAYCSPSRGAQGNATKTIVAMPFALDGSIGRGRIDADRVSHHDPSWAKWLPSLPTSAHWYDLARFERYAAAHVARDRDIGREPERTVREFIGELDGFRRSASQKRVLDATAMHRLPLSHLFGPAGEPRRERIAELLDACKTHSRPVKPHLLGLIGKQHLLARFEAAGVHKETFKYKRAIGEINGLPWVVETAFGYCPEKVTGRRIVTGVNFSVAVGNPFRSFRGYGGEGLEAHLRELRVGGDEPIVVVLHYTCPRVEFTDRGKTALAIPEAE